MLANWRCDVGVRPARNTDTEHARIKPDETAAEIWPDQPAKARQEDTDRAMDGKVQQGEAEP